MLTFDVAIIIIIVVILHTSWMSCPVDPTHFTIFAPLSFYPFIPYCLLPFSVIFTTDRPIQNPYPLRSIVSVLCFVALFIIAVSLPHKCITKQTEGQAFEAKQLQLKKSIKKKQTHTDTQDTKKPGK